MLVNKPNSVDLELGMLRPQEPIATLEHRLDHCPETEKKIFSTCTASTVLSTALKIK